MNLPKFFLVSSKATEAEMEAINKAISFTPVEMALVSRPQDVEKAKQITEHVTGLHRPIVIVADFSDPLTVISDDGSALSVSLSAPADDSNSHSCYSSRGPAAANAQNDPVK